MGIWHATAVRTLSMCYDWLSAGITDAGMFDIMPRHLGTAVSFILGTKGCAGKGFFNPKHFWLVQSRYSEALALALNAFFANL